MAKSKSSTGRPVIVTTQWRDLYYGRVVTPLAKIAAQHWCLVDECRHIAYWQGPRGGLTSLAAEGPGAGSRIGARIDGALITGVAHLLPVTAEAAKKFAEIK